MNNKLLFQDLTDRLSESGKLKKKDAEEFLKAYFTVIDDSIFEGETVKVQGIGTFKLLKVDTRKSVDVTTGKDFEIKEHYKLSFTPDAILKEKVNEPFSYLEPVDLDAKEKPDNQEPIQEIIESEKTVVAAAAAAEEEEEEEEIGTEKQSETIQDTTMTPKNNDFKSPDKEPRQETRPTMNQNQTRKKPEKPVKPKDNGKFFWIFLFLIIVLLAVWAILSNYTAQKENDRKLKEIAIIDADTTFEDTPPEEFETVIEDSLRLEAEIAAKVESLAISEKKGGNGNLASVPAAKTTPVTVSPVKESEKQTVKSKAVSENSPRQEIKFPVYLTLKKGEMLTVISLKYYGSKAFWVYIYAANMDVIKDPDHIPYGTKIRIPKPDPSIINAGDPDCIAKAKALQTKILSRNQ